VRRSPSVDWVAHYLCVGLGLKEKAIYEAEKTMEMFPVTLDVFYYPQVKSLAHMYMILDDHEKTVGQLEILLLKSAQWSVTYR
jgi:hypothetical protein